MNAMAEVEAARQATDQYGEPWIVFERSGSSWALGIPDGEPIIRFIYDGTIQTDVSKPRAYRHLKVNSHGQDAPTPSEK